MNTNVNQHGVYGFLVATNPLKLSGKYMYHLLDQPVNLQFVFGFFMVLTVNSDNQLIFIMVKCGVLFEVRAEFLNDIKTNVGLIGLNVL
jgi:hypothetical protein